MISLDLATMATTARSYRNANATACLHGDGSTERRTAADSGGAGSLLARRAMAGGCLRRLVPGTGEMHFR